MKTKPKNTEVSVRENTCRAAERVDRGGVGGRCTMMTNAQRIRYNAAHLLALCASGRGETLRELADAAAIHDTAAIALARRTLGESIGTGNWREVRAEAEARLRCTNPLVDIEQYRRVR